MFFFFFFFFPIFHSFLLLPIKILVLYCFAAACWAFVEILYFYCNLEPFEF